MIETRSTLPIIDKPHYQRIISGALNNDRKIPVEKLSLEDWLSLRAILGIGGSEVAPVLGISQYETPFSVWQRKVSDEIEIKENDYMEFGNFVEPGLISWYNKRTKSNAVKDNNIRIHPKYNCLFVDLDGVLHDKDGNEIGLVECKSTSYRNYTSWETNTEDCVQGIPLYMYCQVMHELSITGLPWCDLAILITDRRQLKIKRIFRDDDYIERQNTALVMWWNAYVLPNVAPEMTAKELAYVEPMIGSFVEADVETASKFAELVNKKAELKKLEDITEKLQNEIVLKIGDKENLTYSGKVLASYKMQSRTSIQTELLKKEEPEIYDRFKKTSSYRTFRIKTRD